MSTSVDKIKSEIIWLEEILSICEENYNYKSVKRYCPEEYKHYFDYVESDDIEYLQRQKNNLIEERKTFVL